MTPPAAPARARRTIVTPEGVPLNLPVADAGERIGAFIIDLLLLTFAILAVSLLANWLAPDTDEGTAIVDSIALLAAFVIRSFYFVAFELRRQGQTPGKRMMKIRVVDARGGPLTSDAIVARNLVRDVELFMPLSIVLVPDEVWPGAPGWAQAVAAGWALVVLFLPLFNRERARVGDLVAGTRVIAVPRTVLLPDLTTQRAQVAPADRPVFTPEQLDIYGAYELQVLADVLRRKDEPGQYATVETVYQSIRTKLRWQGPTPRDTAAWLEELYAQLRAHLERKMMFGKHKADKHSTPA
jgi:uncharacterized RDD family membrane protein YckC